MWGLGRRHHDYEITNTPTLRVCAASARWSSPTSSRRTPSRSAEEFKLTAGVKFEENSYSGWSTLPDLRLSWAPNENNLVVGSAASRAIRAPTPFDTDVEECAGGTVLFITGDPDFEPEQVDAYELGYRAQPHPVISWSVSTFYNEYDDLRTIEPAAWRLPAAALGQSHGRHAPTASSCGRTVQVNVLVAPVARIPLAAQEPEFQSPAHRSCWARSRPATIRRRERTLKSSMDFGRWTVDAMLRYVAKLPSPESPSYTELSARVAWRASDALEFSLNGANLLDDTHVEYAVPTARAIRRSIYAEARWTF